MGEVCLARESGGEWAIGERGLAVVCCRRGHVIIYLAGFLASPRDLVVGPLYWLLPGRRNS